MVEESRNHRVARDRLAAPEKLVVPSVVLYEMVWVLKKLGVGSEVVRGALEAVLRNPKVEVFPDDGRLAQKALDRVVAERTSLSNFDDKVVLETALKAGASLLTFDTELKREAQRAGVLE